MEAKTSRLPFVFFKAVVPPPLNAFPQIDGVPGVDVMLADARGTARRYSLARVLDIQSEPFISGGPTVCASFSKIVRKGKGIELSGTDPYNSMIMPLVSALGQFHQERRPKSGEVCHPIVTLAVAVLDAPMITFDLSTGTCVLEPWVRVVRDEGAPTKDGSRSFQAIDVVHEGFLRQFISDWVFPFAHAFVERVAANPEIVCGMRGRVPSHDGWSWRDLRP